MLKIQGMLIKCLKREKSGWDFMEKMEIDLDFEKQIGT